MTIDLIARIEKRKEGGVCLIARDNVFLSGKYNNIETVECWYSQEPCITEVPISICIKTTRPVKDTDDLDVKEAIAHFCNSYDLDCKSVKLYKKLPSKKLSKDTAKLLTRGV